jgi:hypothetical protein
VQSELHYFELVLVVVVVVIVLYSYMTACKLVNSDVSENSAALNFMVRPSAVQED